jgi:signal transduction histidine kinase
MVAEAVFAEPRPLRGYRPHLGLSLVKHILNHHRGHLLIESVPKNGATFTAAFPQAKTPEPV